MSSWDKIIAQREHWSNDKLINELTLLSPLPDEQDVAWDIDETWEKAELFVAHAYFAQIRCIEEMVPLLFERASLGEPGEMLRGIFKNSIFFALGKRTDRLVHYALNALNSPRPGTRYWAVYTLQFVRDEPEVKAELERANEDPNEVVKAQARSFAGIDYD